MNKKIKADILVFILICSAVCGLVSISFAEIPHFISYQGKLTDNNNKPLDGLYKIAFIIYDRESGGNLLWQEVHPNTLIQKGVFSVQLGSVNTVDFKSLGFDKPYFLEIKVGDEVMTPRQAITSSGYAIRAEKAESALSAQRADVAVTLSDTSALVPKGAIIMCRSGCPTGYARVGELDGKFLVGGATYNPAAGGSNTHTHTVPVHSHTLASGTVNGISAEATGVYVAAGSGGFLRLTSNVFPPQPGTALQSSTT